VTLSAQNVRPSAGPRVVLAGPVVSPTAATIVVDFATPYAGGQTIDQRLWGMAAGSASDNGYSIFTDGNFQTAAAAVNPRLWRTWGKASTSLDPNTFGPLVSSLYKCNPTGDTHLIAEAIGASQSAMQNLASTLMPSKMLNGALFAIIGFEIANESTTADPSAVVAAYNGLQAAGSSPILGRPLYMCAPVSACVNDPTNCQYDWGSYMSQLGNSVDVIDWHAYVDCKNEDLQQAYWGAPYATRFADDVSGADATLSAHQKTLPMFLGEYNIQCYWQYNTPSMQTSVGGVWAALMLVNGLSCPNITGTNRRLWATLWDSWSDNLYGAIGGAAFNNGTYNIDPQGQLIGAAGATIKGPRYVVHDNSGSGLVTVACIPPNPNNLNPPPMSLMVINVSGSDLTPSVGFSHAPVGTATVYGWQMSSGTTLSFNPNGGANSASPTGYTVIPVIRKSTSATFSMTNGIISGGVSLPNGSVTIFYTQTDFPNQSWIAT